MSVALFRQVPMDMVLVQKLHVPGYGREDVGAECVNTFETDPVRIQGASD